jgi:hypothetical protein
MEGKINGVRFCKVISISDDTDADRIKVRLSPEDNNKSDTELDFAFPILPKMLHIKPKVGEAVLVLLATMNDGNSQRYYIGPVISQDHKLNFDPYFCGADSFLRGAYKKFDVAPRMNPEQQGILPKDDDIVIRGRKNADIQITDNDVIIKSGVKVVNESNNYEMSFNTKNPSYIKTRYHTEPLIDGSKSTSTIVGDKIVLLSNTSPNYFNLTDRNDLITDKELNNVIDSAYKLPYGEKLVEFLKIFVKAFNNHTHNYPMLPPNPFHLEELNVKSTEMLDNEKILSNTVRIN